MNRHERIVLWIVFALLALGFAISRFTCRGPADNMPPPSTAVLTPTPKVSTPVAPVAVASISAPAVTTVPTPMPATKPKKPTKIVPTTAPASDVTLHKELIPKDIDIVRCYYNQEITPPAASFGFDLNGSGFTSQFQKMISLKSDDPAVHFKNLTLVTANQIHGDIEVGPDAKTAFVYPQVLIKGLPVFRAPDPFAIVRKGEVLTVIFISMEENGRGGRFRVITNLDDDLAKQFHIEPSTPGLEISDLENHLPYVIEGRLGIGPGVPPGDYGLVIKVADHEVLRRAGMIRIVRPNIGQTGLIQSMIDQDLYHRPGDQIDLFLQGSGLTPPDVLSLKAGVDGFDMGPASFTYISRSQCRFSFQSPTTTPVGNYNVTVLDGAGQKLFSKSDAFTIIPADWIKGVQVSPPVQSGGKSQLRIIGRDLSAGFIQSLHIDVDEPGIVLQPIVRVSDTLATTEIAVAANVAPGDYWLHLSANGHKIDPPFGSIIKVEAK